MKQQDLVVSTRIGFHAIVAPWRVARLVAGVGIALAVMLAGAVPSMAQGGEKMDNVLYPHPIPIPLYVGIEAGFGRWTDKGGFSVPDGNFSCASFLDGKGNGVTLGVKGMIYLNRWFFISPRFRYEPRPGTFTTPLDGEPIRLSNDSLARLEEQADVDATFAAMTFDLNIGIELFHTGVYIFGGGSGSLMLDGYYNYTEQINGPASIIFNDVRGTRHTLVTGRSFPTYRKSSFDLRGGGGFLLRIGRLAFNPEIFVSRPLTSVLSAPDEMKQTGLLGTFSLMYNIGN